MKPYLLLVAGESSGDRLGECLVQACVARGLKAMGAGGARMQAAGLEPLVPFADLGVAGFWDVLPRVRCLKRHLETLRAALTHELCRGLVCIDYPGFNLRLSRLAHCSGKPVFWIAPPQLWAWKPARGKDFVGKEVCVFFPFEVEAYQKAGALPIKVRHPLLDEIPVSCFAASKPCIALLPGSRWRQALRNGDAFVRMAQQSFAGSAVLVAPDASMAQRFRDRWGDHITVETAATNAPFWRGVTHAICAPGTASLELALRGIRLVVFSRIDLLTYFLGRLFLRTPYLALPNLLLARKFVPEFLVPAWPWTRQKVVQAAMERFWKEDHSDAAQIAQILRADLEYGAQELPAIFWNFLREYGYHVGDASLESHRQ